MNSKFSVFNQLTMSKYGDIGDKVTSEEVILRLVVK